MVGIIISWWLKIPEIEFSLDMAYEPLDVTKKMWRCDQDRFLCYCFLTQYPQDLLQPQVYKLSIFIKMKTSLWEVL